MRTMLITAALCATAFAADARGQAIGSPPPELDAIKWYNSPPLTLEELRGKAVLVEVFRTW